MLSVLNINPEPIQKETYAQLEQMGFTSDLIKQAYAQSGDKSIAGLLNWLLEHQPDVKKNDSKESKSNSNQEFSHNVLFNSKKKSKNSRRHKISE